MGVFEFVLIETLWNVKFNSAGGYWNIYYRINRNIVECKVIGIAIGFLAKQVLIETLWNVKLQEHQEFCFHCQY